MYTYSQWRTSLQRLCLQSFDSPNIQREITNLTDEEVEQYVQENTDAVVAYINSLDTENGYSGKDGTLTQYEMSYFGDKELVEKLIRSLHLDFSLEKGIDMAQFVEVLKKYKQERAGVVLATREYQQQVEGILDPKTTKLQDEEREDIDQYNFNSFLERLEGYFSTHRDLHVDVTRPEGYTMVGHSKRANVETEEAILSKENYIEQMRDYDVFTAVLAKLGYSDERSGWRKFWTGSWSTKQEHETFLARVQNTERGNILDIESIKQYLFDLNGDSVITATMDDGLTEISPYDYVKTHEDTLNFLENLGFPRDFQVLRNLSFRDQFATRLVEVMKLHVPFTVLVQKDGYKNFMKEYLETEQKLREQVMMDLSDADIEEKLRNAGVEITPEAKDIVKQVTVFIAMGHISAFGVNINIKELTHGILDGLNLGMTSK
ncbi:MAG: hypothetical protein H6767_07030 [Candidatus Peribacteria bacterium]|nr:MAG: hypothetical protein H6767_07030 [Candidatus Peribacteria bacterium]